MNSQSSASSHQTEPKKRRRPALACVNCRRRKLRCDHAKPCNNCTKAGADDCVYPPTHTPVKQSRVRHSSSRRSREVANPLSAHSPSTRTPSSQQPARRPDVGTNTSNIEHERRLPLTPSSCDSTLQSQSQVHSSGDKVDRLLARISELEGTVARISEASHPRRENQPDTDAARAASDTNSTSGPKFGNQSSWMNNTSLYTKVLRPLSKAQNGQPELIRSLNSCKSIARRVEDRVAVQTAAVGIGTRIPEKPVADQLLSAYFDHFEGPFRVLHIPSFRDEYERYWNQRDTAPDTFVLQLQLCMALGALSHSDSLLWRNASSQWLIEAQTWLHHSFVRMKRALTFEELQVACLSCIVEASLSGTDSIHHCWVQAGDLYRKAVCFGLNRDPTALGTMSTRQAEMRRRLWATILELNLLLSMQAGRSPLITTSEYDTRRPLNLQDEDLNENPMSETHSGRNSETPTATSAQLALHDSFHFRSTIVCQVNSIQGEIPYSETLKLHSELSKAEWRMQQKNARLAQFTTDTNSGLVSSHLLLSEVLVSRYFLALHLTKLGQSIKNPAFHFSRRICLVTSLRLAEACGILSSTKTRDHALAPSRGFKQLFINTMGVFRNMAIQAVFAVILELITLKEEQCENQGALAVWDEAELFQHLKSIEAWTADQLQAGTTDFRTFCYTRACIAYTEALNQDAPQNAEHAISEAALKSNESYYELMNEVAAKLGLFTGASPTPMQDVERPGTSNAVTAEAPADWIGGLLGDAGGNVDFDWSFPADSSVDMNWFMTF